MSKFASERARCREDLIDLASCYADRVRERYGPATVLLYGSVARGDFNLWSDVDVLVISDALPTHPLARSEALHCLVLPGVEPKGFTVREYQDAAALGRPFMQEIARQCVVLRDDLGLAAQARV